MGKIKIVMGGEVREVALVYISIIFLGQVLLAYGAYGVSIRDRLNQVSTIIFFAYSRSMNIHSVQTR